MSVFAKGLDINADNKVDVNDVTYLQNELSGFTDNMDYDLNNDGRVDVNDISTLQIEISNNNIKNIEANTKLSVVTNEYKKNVGDTVTFSIITNNAISDITYSSSDSTVAKIVSSDKNMVKVKVNKVGTATITAQQCSKSVSVKFNVDKAKCIDISEWNCDINFNKVRKAGVTCVIIRAGYGKDPNQEDNEFQKYYKQAKAAGLNVGAYWYSYATSVDAAKSMLVDSAYPDELASKYLIWIAAPNTSYSDLPSYVDLWQYSWTGPVDGIRGDVDLNYIYNLN